jgi:hypothetical protein
MFPLIGSLGCLTVDGSDFFHEVSVFYDQNTDVGLSQSLHIESFDMLFQLIPGGVEHGFVDVINF